MAKRTLDASERLHARARVQREAKRTNCTPATWRTNKPPSGGCVSGVVLGAFLAPSPYLDNRDNNFRKRNRVLALMWCGFALFLKGHRQNGKNLVLFEVSSNK